MKLTEIDGFVVFIAENPNNNFKIPAKYLLELLKSEPTANDDNWKIHIFETRTNFEFRISKEKIDLSDYLNLYQIDNGEIQFHQKQILVKEISKLSVEKNLDVDFDNLNIQDQIRILRKNQLDIMKKIGL